MDVDDIANRFRYHPPLDELTGARHDEVRTQLHMVAIALNGLCPDGREKSLAITKLEEAMMWANAAIARAPHKPAG